MAYCKLEKVIKFLAWADLIILIIQLCYWIFQLVGFSWGVRYILKTMDPKVKESFNDSINIGLIIAVKLLYFIILLLIGEVILAWYLIRAVSQGRLSDLRIWLKIAAVCTLLYITDFISTLHAFSLSEDLSVTTSIFVKLPLLILVYTHYKQLSRGQENLEIMEVHC